MNKIFFKGAIVLKESKKGKKEGRKGAQRERGRREIRRKEPREEKGGGGIEWRK